MITLREGALKLVHEHFLSGISEGKPAFLEEKQFTDPSMLSPKQRRNIGRRGIQHVINEWSLTIGALHESEQGIEKKKVAKIVRIWGTRTHCQWQLCQTASSRSLPFLWLWHEAFDESSCPTLSTSRTLSGDGRLCMRAGGSGPKERRRPDRFHDGPEKSMPVAVVHLDENIMREPGRQSAGINGAVTT
jgi:hypothetical protein